MTIHFFDHANGEKTAYQQTQDEGIGVFCVGGHRSTMDRPRYPRYRDMLAEKDIGFTWFDWQGFGQSSGEREVEGLIRHWGSQMLDIFDNCTSGKQIVMGISMGGWLMHLLALHRPERVAGLVGVCPGFGLGLCEKSAKHYGVTRVCTLEDENKGFDYDDNGGKHAQVLSAIDVHCPVRLYHSYTDETVGWQVSQTALSHLPENCDAKLLMTRGGAHKMDREQDFETIINLVEELARDAET